jgi:hypothetical protein
MPESMREAVEGFERERAEERGEIAPAPSATAWEAIQRNEFEKTSLAWTLMTDTMRGAKTPGIASGSHAIAALALYDTRFGFTQEDLELLEFAALVMLHSDEHNESQDEEAAQLRKLSARIAALLPPGKPTS